MSDVQGDQTTDQPQPTTDPQATEVAGLIQTEVAGLIQRAVHELLALISNLRTHVVEAGGVATPAQIEEVHNAALQVQEVTGVGPVPNHEPGVVPQNEPTTPETPSA